MANFRKSFNFRNGVQVDDDNFVVSSNGAVGIGTSIPLGYLLDVRGDASISGLVTSSQIYSGVGTVTNLTSTNFSVGVITATQLKLGSSEIVSNLIGYARTTFITDNGGIGLHTTSKIGINTTTSPGASDDELVVGGDATINGTLTATTFSGSGASLTSIPNSATTATNTNTNSTIVARDASGNFSAGTISAALSGNATTASNLTGSPSITVTNVSASSVDSSTVTATTELNVGTGGTALTSLNSGRLGIGTANPTSEIQVRKSSGSLLEVISDSGQARISIGQSVGVGKSTGVIRFGNSANDLDIINNDNDGDINFLLNGNGSAGNGKFSWKDGNGFTEVMSVSSNGNFSVLGITTLASNGGITTTGGHLYVNNNLSVGGTITATDITLPSIVSAPTLFRPWDFIWSALIIDKLLGKLSTGKDDFSPDDKVGASPLESITFSGLSSVVASPSPFWAIRLKLAKAIAKNATPCLRVIFFMCSLYLHEVLRLSLILNKTENETQSQ